MAHLEEIEAIYHGESFRWGETLVGQVELANGSRLPGIDPWISIKGEADIDELKDRQRYRFYGRFSNYTNKRTGKSEKQFHFQTFVQAITHDRKSVIEYLAAAGQGLGIGKATAEKLYDAHGESILQQIRENPRILVSSRVTPDDAERIALKLRHQKSTEDATIELTGLLVGRGLPKSTARAAIKKWGNLAATVIKRDPYKLMQLKGCGFKRADSLWLEFGNPPSRLKRQVMCGWYELASNSDGHSWFDETIVTQSIRQNIGSAKANPARAIKCGVRLGAISHRHYGAMWSREEDGKRWLADAGDAWAEDSLADLVTDAIKESEQISLLEFGKVTLTEYEQIHHATCRRCGRRLTAPDVHVINGVPYGPTCVTKLGQVEGVEVIPLDDWLGGVTREVKHTIEVPTGRIEFQAYSMWPDPDSISGISDHQRDQLHESLVSRIAILGGSPGTGKTFATAQVIKTLLASGKASPEDVAIGCPTGKAAVRLTETMNAAGVNLRARTWHSLLGYSDSGFEHDEENPWPFRILIGDESSMLDTSLMRAIFAARPRGCHMLLVGDVNQLPPVGRGAPFRDIIASQVCGYGELREIMRNSGGIVEACAAIRDEQPWECGDNLRLIDAGSAEKQIESLVDLLGSLPANIDPVWDCQVLVAVNDRSELSRKAINARLQDFLNTNPEVKGSPFRFDDKIVCLKNGRYTAIECDDDANANEGRQIYVANGELAQLIEIEPQSFIAKLTSPYRLIRIPRGKQSDDDEGESETGAGCNWDLAYGLSTHKSQGSEWPVVIVMLDDYRGASMVCDRSWAYTAISRARQQCILIGRKSTADAMCKRNNIHKRKTFLRERIQENHWANVLGDL